MQAACYGSSLREPDDVWQARLARTAAHWRVAVDEGGALHAYLAAYPSVPGAVTPLHGAFSPARDAGTLYLHDLAVHPDHAGRGLGQALVAALLAQARDGGVRQAALVAVEGAAAFWERQGFAAQPAADAAMRAALAGYGEGALYMVLPLDIPSQVPNHCGRTVAASGIYPST
ncbi:MAG: hypothetical protein GAK38_03689 [Xylophilus sp.]|nr:MAG: hypothetical protein GAK38_03689 [Xylophilus sp.]